MTEKVKPMVTRVVKIICILLGCMFFMPAFTVSCSGKTVDVTPVHSVVGYYGESSYSGEAEVFSNPAPWILLLLAIPVVILIIWNIISNDSRKKITLYSLSSTGIILYYIIWRAFEKRVYSVADEWSADVETQFGYTCTNILLVLLAVFVVAHAILTFIPKSTESKTIETKKSVNNKQENNTEGTKEPVSIDSVRKGLNNKKMTIPAIVIASIIAVAGIAIVIMNNRTIEIDISKYLNFEYDGYNTIGTAQLQFDENGFIQDYGRRIHFTKDGKNSFGSSTVSDAFITTVQQFIPSGTYASGLTNGEEIYFEWNEDLETRLERYFKVDVNLDNVSSEVTGLEVAPSVDLFSSLNVVVEGTAPNGHIVFDGGSNEYSLSYTATPSTGLSNGDEVIISAYPRYVGDGDDVNRYMIENYQVIPEEDSFTYTVEGLPSYLMTVSEIPDDIMNQMQSQALSVVQSEVAGVISRNTDDPDNIYAFGIMTTTLNSIEYAGNYYLTAKSYDNLGWGNYSNELIMVYRVNLHTDFYIPDGFYNENGGCYTQEDFSYFIAVSFDNIIMLPDNSCSVNLSDYRFPCPDQAHDSSELPGYLALDILYYSGYDNFETLKNDLITQNVDSYNYEDNVDMSIIEAVIVSESEITEDDGNP